MVPLRGHEGARHQHRAVARAGLIFAACVCCAFSAAPSDQSPHANPAKGAQRAQADERGSKEQPAFVTLTQTPESKKEAADIAKAGQDEAKTQWYLLYLTGALALAAFLQWIILVVQTRHISRSVRVAERALTELERPFLALEIVDPAIEEITEGEKPSRQVKLSRLDFRFRNVGRTPAFIHERMDQIALMDELLPAALDPNAGNGMELPYGVVIPAGEKSVVYQSQQFPADVLLDAIFKSGANKHFVFHGYVRFSDIFSNNHVTGFCTVYSEYDRTFILAGGEEYNYTKTIERASKGAFAFFRWLTKPWRE
jgi:hypothetical protein